MTTQNSECEYCAQQVGPRRVIEHPFADEVVTLSKFFWVIDPARLVFCDAECRSKWHGLRRKAIWHAHGADCACLACMTKA